MSSNEVQLTLDLPVPEQLTLQLRPVFERLPDSLFVFSPAGELLQCNHAALQLLRVTAQDDARLQVEQATKLYTLAELDGSAIAPERWPQQRVLRGEAFSDWRLKVTRRDGAWSYCASCSGVPLRNARGGLAQAMVLIRDVSETARPEEARGLELALCASEHRLRDIAEQLQEADRRKDEFIAMLAHELRNPLGPIRNGVYLLNRIGADSEKHQQIRSMIERQVTHMTRLIDDLLDISRIARGKVMLEKSNIDLVELTRQVADDYRSAFDAAKLSLQLSTPPDSVPVFADKTRVAQALGNLLHNAIKYSHPGDTVCIRLAVQDTAALLSVKDSGTGIAPALLPMLFEPFAHGSLGAKNPKSGLGLGLALVKGLIGLHGGSVAARSEGFGQGAEFTIELPIRGQRPLIIEEPHQVERSGHRILIIEDNTEAAETLEMLLQIGGHDVRIAASATAAQTILKDWTPETIVCDIGLPEVDGYTLCRQMRSNERLKATRIIALTGYGQDDDIRRAKAAGFDLHLTKPVDPHELEGLLARAQ